MRVSPVQPIPLKKRIQCKGKRVAKLGSMPEQGMSSWDLHKTCLVQQTQLRLWTVVMGSSQGLFGTTSLVKCHASYTLLALVVLMDINRWSCTQYSPSTLVRKGKTEAKPRNKKSNGPNDTPVPAKRLLHDGPQIAQPIPICLYHLALHLL